MEDKGTSRDVSFCAHTLVGEMPLVVTDPTSDVRFKNNALVTGGLGIRFYAGAPLITSKEEAHLGALCVIDQKAKQDLSEEQKKLLNALAKLAVKCIEGPEMA
jgi:GAF domain-containing protein